MVLFLYPDHEGWIIARINSKIRQHCDILGDIDEVLGKLHVLEEFKQGPFGHYLGLHLPVTIHGKAYQTESITDDQVGYELPGVIPNLDNQETKKKKEQIDSHSKLCPPSVQRTLFLNNESPKTSAKPNGMDDIDPKKVTYKSICGMMTKVLFDVLLKVLPQAVVKDVLPNKGTEKKKNTSKVITKVLYDVLLKVLPQALNDVLPKFLP
ncbi:hypothetical protein LWI28_003946 [Acer negundo]|uniref:Uncharacterized protein n=1 Tax=Acer negundo TaxID=4023 RepID=A0AAD5IYD9_ACENE|nr:hypothetical protein LWI28_003946 [Acer negundo]